MKLIKNFILTIIFVSFASAVHAETKMRITLQLPLKAHLGQNLLVFKLCDIPARTITVNCRTTLEKFCVAFFDIPPLSF